MTRNTSSTSPTALPSTIDLMLPILRIIEDGNEYTIRQLRDLIADTLELTQAQCSLLSAPGINVLQTRLEGATTLATGHQSKIWKKAG